MSPPDRVMIALERICHACPNHPLSAKRYLLCSRENAQRVASKMFDAQAGRVSIVRTEDVLQPFVLSTAPGRDAHVEVEIVS